MTGPRITDLSQFDDKTLVDLKTWLEPWFRAKRAGGGAGSGEHDLMFTIDGGGSVLTTGVQCETRVDFNCTIMGWSLVADQVGSIQIDLWKDVFANYPPTVADTITASAKPTLSSDDANSSTTLTGWTTMITAGDVIRLNIDSVATVTRVELILHIQE